MRRLIIAALLLLLPAAAHAQSAACSFANPTACGSPGMNNAAIGGTLTVGGLSTLSGGGAFSGIFSGNHTYSGVITYTGGVAGTMAANIVEVNSINTYGNTITLSGATVPTYMGNLIANWAGTSTRTDNTSIAAFHIGASSDNANFSNSGGTRDELLISSSYGGTSFSGFRIGAQIQMNFNTASTLTADGGGSGLNTKVVPSVNFGGSAGNYKGAFFGANPWADCKTGYTFGSQCVGMEVDAALQTGASASNFTMFQAVLTSDHATHGINADNGYALVAQTGASAGLFNGWVVGSYQAQWPMDLSGNGYLFKLETSSNYNTFPSTLAGGWDELQGIFSGAGVNGGNFSFRSPGPSSSVPATAIDGSGGLKLGPAYMIATASALTFDTGLYSFAGVSSIVSGGTNYTGNGSSGSDIVDDGYGNEFYVTASSGVVSALTLKVRAEGQISAPAVSSLTFNNLVVTGTSAGSGLIVTENAWTQSGTTLKLGTTTATTIGIGNSGSTTTISGIIKAGSGTGSSRTCTVNQNLTLIFTNGILTGGTCNS
jgi:hypothetical protein